MTILNFLFPILLALTSPRFGPDNRWTHGSAPGPRGCRTFGQKDWR